MPAPSFKDWRKANPDKQINDYYQELSGGKLNVEQPSPTPISTSAPTINNIYLQNNNGVQEGPFSFEYLQNRKIDSNTLVWFEGMENWLVAGDVFELRGIVKQKQKAPLLPPNNKLAQYESPKYQNQPEVLVQNDSGISDNYIFENDFGTVTNKRITFMSGSSFFGKKTRVDIPIRHITFIEHKTERHIFSGILLIFFGIMLIPIIIGLFLVLSGIYNIIGYSEIKINTSGNDTLHSKVKPMQKAKADKFVSELREVLFR